MRDTKIERNYRRGGDWVDLSFSRPPLKLVPEIHLFPKLRSLHLNNNNISEFPTLLEKYEELTYIDLSNNYIENIDLSVGSKFMSLAHLDLSFNSIRSVGEVAGFGALEVLLLNNNKIKTLPESLGQLTALKKIHLDNNEIEELPQCWDSMKIEESKLEGNQLHSKTQSILKGFLQKRMGMPGSNN